MRGPTCIFWTGLRPPSPQVQELDGTQNEWGWCKQKLGANAILAVSLAGACGPAVVARRPAHRPTSASRAMCMGGSLASGAFRCGCYNP